MGAGDGRCVMVMMMVKWCRHVSCFMDFVLFLGYAVWPCNGKGTPHFAGNIVSELRQMMVKTSYVVPSPSPCPCRRHHHLNMSLHLMPFSSMLLALVLRNHTARESRQYELVHLEAIPVSIPIQDHIPIRDSNHLNQQSLIYPKVTNLGVDSWTIFSLLGFPFL